MRNLICWAPSGGIERRYYCCCGRSGENVTLPSDGFVLSRVINSHTNWFDIEHVALLADVDLRFEIGHFEVIIAFLQHAPKGHVWIATVPDQVNGRHAKWISLHLERALISGKRSPCECVYLSNLFVGNGVTPGRGAAAMHHYVSTRPAVCAVVSIGIANVERQIVVRVGVHLPRRHGIEPLGGLAVAFPYLRT